MFSNVWFSEEIPPHTILSTEHITIVPMKPFQVLLEPKSLLPSFSTFPLSMGTLSTFNIDDLQNKALMIAVKIIGNNVTYILEISHNITLPPSLIVYL